MKQAFLDLLAGKTPSEAERLVKSEGHEAMVIESGIAIAAIAIANTVILWEDEGVVKLASAGDPLELDR